MWECVWGVYVCCVCCECGLVCCGVCVCVYVSVCGTCLRCVCCVCVCGVCICARARARARVSCVLETYSKQARNSAMTTLVRFLLIMLAKVAFQALLFFSAKPHSGCR